MRSCVSSGDLDFSEIPACLPGGDSYGLCGTQALTCNAASSCGGCGGVGQPCCGSQDSLGRCVASGTACLRTRDDPWKCTPCGAAGQPCCRGVQFTPRFPPCHSNLRCILTADGFGYSCVP